jgi:hypothetical protein
MKKIILFLGTILLTNTIIAQVTITGITYSSTNMIIAFTANSSKTIQSVSANINNGGGTASKNITSSPMSINDPTDFNFTSGSSTSIELTVTYTDNSTETSSSVSTTIPSSLPVELTLFKNNDNYLIWQTASEKNNKGFEIYKSEDGKIWNQDGFVMGSNNSVTINNYTYLTTDKTSMYYRLRQVDFDDQIEWLPIIFVKRSGEAEKRYFDLNGNDKGPFYIQEGKKFQELR